MTHRTGDINLFSACMALGIPPNPIEPAAVLQNDDGRDYLSFNLEDLSECGRFHTKVMSDAWSQSKAFKAEFPNHPFTLLMDFIKHAKGARRKDDWIERGASFLSISRDAFRKALRDVSIIEANAPESDLAYLTCFIANRFAAAGWAKSAIPKVVVNVGKSILLMDGNLPIKKQNYLLGHL